ncbi:MAG TPA: diol dehydratase small subunit [Dermatophilaceae bacterium]|jgi:propanediol dehydratase small subunit
MDSEELIRTIMAEVMKQLDADEVGIAKASPSTPAGSASTGGSGASARRATAANYPLAEKMPEAIKTSTGKSLNDISLDKVKSGDIGPDDLRISPETLELQAQVAESVGRSALARNMRRASELIAVPDEELLTIYNALRPYRSTRVELMEIAAGLEKNYGGTINASFIRQAAEVYERRGRLKRAE